MKAKLQTNFGRQRGYRSFPVILTDDKLAAELFFTPSSRQKNIYSIGYKQNQLIATGNNISAQRVSKATFGNGPRSGFFIDKRGNGKMGNIVETLDLLRRAAHDVKEGLSDQPYSLAYAESKIAAMESAGIVVSPSPARLGTTMTEVLKR